MPADKLQSGDGVVVLIGGLGNDVFQFTATVGSTQAARDVITAGDGAVAFEKAGAALGDRFDFSTIDANTGATGTQDFVFGSAMGVGRLWAVNSGTNTLIRGNVHADAAVDFEIAIADGGVLAGVYAAADFHFLGAIVLDELLPALATRLRRSEHGSKGL